MFDELKEVKYFKEITDFKSLMQNTLKNITFEESSKTRVVFRTQANI